MKTTFVRDLKVDQKQRQRFWNKVMIASQVKDLNFFLECKKKISKKASLCHDQKYKKKK